MLESLWNDVRYALRMMAKKPGFTAVAVFALALGIGANTTIFSAVNALLLRPFAFRDLDRIAVIYESHKETPDERNAVAFGNFHDIRTQSASFDAAAAIISWSANLSESDRPERIEGVAVSPQFFEVLGVSAEQGRVFLPEEEKATEQPIVIISDGLWRRRFGGDPNIFGRTVRINERSFNVVGIMPPQFNFPKSGVEIWTPLVAEQKDLVNRDAHFLNVVARLKPGVTIESARAELDTLAARFSAQYPDTNSNVIFSTDSLTHSETRGPRPFLLMALAAVLFVLLIACANVANLQLMRAATRQREIAVRLALGASRWRVVRQLLTESVLLSIMGGALGLLLSVWAVDALASALPANFAKFVNGWQNLRIDWRVFVFTLAVSLMTGIVFGLVPALLTTKTDLNEALKEGSRAVGTGRGGARMRNLLVISEVALALVLLVGAGLLARSFMRLLQVNPGFNTQNVLALDVSLPYRKYVTPEQNAAFYAELTRRVGTLPGVEAATVTNLPPLSLSDDSVHFAVDGRTPTEPAQQPLADYRVITPGYFKTLQINSVAGRNFDERDVRGKPLVGIIDERMARRFFPNESPIGKQIKLGDTACEIVGVVGDVRHKSFISVLSDTKLRPAIYVPHAQRSYRQVSLLVRSATNDPAALAAAVRKEVAALDSDLPVYNVRTMPQIFVEAMAPQRLSAFMFLSFAAIALLLAAIGIYAVVAYSVAHRTHEIGVRMALGAQAADILKLIIRQGMGVVLIGLGIGLAGALALTRVMASVLYGISSTDPLTFVGVGCLLAFVALLASYLPARCAMKVEPVVALRHE